MNPDILKLHSLGKIQTNRIAREIVWNSLFINEYENRYGIDPHIVADYAEGYLDWVCEEFGATDENWDKVLFRYCCDNKSGYSFYDYIHYMVCLD
jgi:hypothetical protein